MLKIGKSIIDGKYVSYDVYENGIIIRSFRTRPEAERFVRQQESGQIPNPNEVLRRLMG